MVHSLKRLACQQILHTLNVTLLCKDLNCDCERCTTLLNKNGAWKGKLILYRVGCVLGLPPAALMTTPVAVVSPSLSPPRPKKGRGRPKKVDLKCHECSGKEFKSCDSLAKHRRAYHFWMRGQAKDQTHCYWCGIVMMTRNKDRHYKTKKHIQNKLRYQPKVLLQRLKLSELVLK